MDPTISRGGQLGGFVGGTIGTVAGPIGTAAGIAIGISVGEEIATRMKDEMRAEKRPSSSPQKVQNNIIAKVWANTMSAGGITSVFKVIGKSLKKIDVSILDSKNTKKMAESEKHVDAFPILDSKNLKMTESDCAKFKESFEDGVIGRFFRRGIGDAELKSDTGKARTEQKMDAYKDYGLTKEEVLAVEIYSGEDFRLINHARDGDGYNKQTWISNQGAFLISENDKRPMSKLNPTEQKEVMEGSLEAANQISECLASALNKLPPHQEPVFRQVRISPDELSKFEEGKTNGKGHSFVEKKFVSTTLTLDGALGYDTKGIHNVGYTKVVFEIEPPLRGADISKLSIKDGEEEVLMNCGAKFVSTSFDEKKGDDGELYYLIKLKQENV